jgi:hypothetical protein
VGAAVAIGLGLVLPGLLALATLPEARAGLAHVTQDGSASDLQGLLAGGTALWLFFVLSFWAATLLGNTMRAVLTAVLGVGALVLCTLLSAWLAEQIGGLETGLLCNLTAWRQLPPDFYMLNQGEAVLWGSIAGGLILSFVALAQSLVQFRRPQVQRAVVAKCAALLLAIAFLAALWCADFRVSADSGYDFPLRQEVTRALWALPYTEGGLPGHPDEVRITEMDLEKVSPLSARTKRWLSGASLYLWSEPVQFSFSGKPRIAQHGLVRIEFPNGRECWWDYGTWREGR